jgi:hypothetical protein
MTYFIDPNEPVVVVAKRIGNGMVKIAGPTWILERALRQTLRPNERLQIIEIEVNDDRKLGDQKYP